MKKHKKSPTTPVRETVSRFDLESQIMACWTMTDDLRAFVKSGADTDELRALARVYDRKFDMLFETFSTMISQGQFVEPVRQTSQI